MLLGLIILLLYNLAGALFLGDAGSYAIGGTIGILMIYCYHRAAGGLPVLAAVLWLLLPVVDCLRVMAMRALHQRSPLEADKTISTIASPATGAGLFAWPFTWLWWSFQAQSGRCGPNTSLAMIVISLACYGGLLLLTAVGRGRRGGPRLIWPPAGRRRAQALTARVDRPR